MMGVVYTSACIVISGLRAEVVPVSGNFVPIVVQSGKECTSGWFMMMIIT